MPCPTIQEGEEIEEGHGRTARKPLGKRLEKLRSLETPLGFEAERELAMDSDGRKRCMLPKVQTYA